MVYVRVAHDYRAEIGGERLELREGQVLDLTVSRVLQLLRDSSGCVVPLPPDQQAGPLPTPVNGHKPPAEPTTPRRPPVVMALYRFTAAYGSSLGRVGLAAYQHWPADAVVELSIEDAEYIERDSPGVLEPMTDTWRADATDPHV